MGSIRSEITIPFEEHIYKFIEPHLTPDGVYEIPLSFEKRIKVKRTQRCFEYLNNTEGKYLVKVKMINPSIKRAYALVVYLREIFDQQFLKNVKDFVIKGFHTNETIDWFFNTLKIPEDKYDRRGRAYKKWKRSQEYQQAQKELASFVMAA